MEYRSNLTHLKTPDPVRGHAVAISEVRKATSKEVSADANIVNTPANDGLTGGLKSLINVAEAVSGSDADC